MATKGLRPEPSARQRIGQYSESQGLFQSAASSFFSKQMQQTSTVIPNDTVAMSHPIINSHITIRWRMQKGPAKQNVSQGLSRLHGKG